MDKIKFLLFAISGGGVYGLGIAYFIYAIHKNLGIDLTKYASGWSGTSVGAILSGLYSIGRSPKYVYLLMKNDLKSAFKKRRFAWVSRKSKYLDTGIKKLLRREFGNMRFCDTKKPLWVYCRRTFGGKSVDKVFNPKDTEYIRDGIYASMAAQGYFPPDTSNPNEERIDGGTAGANNPTMIGLSGANGEYFPRNEFESVACIHFRTGGISKRKRWGCISLLKAGVKTLQGVADAGQDVVNYYAREILEDRFLTISPEDTAGASLDSIDKQKEIVEMWEKESFVSSAKILNFMDRYKPQ